MYRWSRVLVRLRSGYRIGTQPPRQPEEEASDVPSHAMTGSLAAARRDDVEPPLGSMGAIRLAASTTARTSPIESDIMVRVVVRNAVNQSSRERPDRSIRGLLLPEIDQIRCGDVRYGSRAWDSNPSERAASELRKVDLQIAVWLCVRVSEMSCPGPCEHSTSMAATSRYAEDLAVSQTGDCRPGGPLPVRRRRR